MCEECKLIFARRLYEKRLRDLQLGASGEPNKECPQAPASATAMLTATAAAATALGSTANAARHSNAAAGGAKAKRDRSRVGKSGKAEQQSPPNWPPRVAGGGGGGTSTNHSVSQLIGGRPTPAPGLGPGLGVGRVPMLGSQVGLGVCMEVGRGVGAGVGVGGGDSVGSGFFCGGFSDSSFPFAGIKQSSPFALDYSPSLGLLAGHQSHASCGSGGGALSSAALFSLNPLPPPFPSAAQAPCWSGVVSGVLNYTSDPNLTKSLVLHCVHFWHKQMHPARASKPPCRALDCPSGRAGCSAEAPGSTCNSRGRRHR